jgi:hypothetical protein
MAKFCNNGHQMEDSWTDCPYCVKTGYRAASTGSAGKTRPDMGETRPDEKPKADLGKTVLLTALKKAPVVGWLVVMNGAQKGDDFRLHEGRNSLGTASDAEVALRDPAVSQKHASISYKEGEFTLTDLDSTNGTFVNDGAEGVARVQLRDNDTIRVGETTLKFKCL